MGMAVGRDRFRADAHEVMKFMQALQARSSPFMSDFDAVPRSCSSAPWQNVVLIPCHEL